MNKTNIVLGLSFVVLVGSSVTNYMLMKELKSLKVQGLENKEVNKPIVDIDGPQDFAEEPTPSVLNILSRNGIQPSSSTDNLTFYPKSTSVNEQRPSMVIDQSGKAFFFSGTKGITIDDGSVSSTKLTLGAVTSDKILNGTIKAEDLGPDAVTSDKILNGTIKAEDLGPDAVTSDKILNGTIKAEDLGPNAVTSDKILNGTIKAEDILGGEIKNSNLGPDAVTSDKILNGTIKAEDLGLANNSIPSEKIGSIRLTYVSVSGDQKAFASCPAGSNFLSGSCFLEPSTPIPQLLSTSGVRQDRGNVGMACKALTDVLVHAHAVCITGIPTIWSGVSSLPPSW